jgi:HD-GYP domain-containing protein (c-di-GMP phosphodiesterase class II)
MREENGKQFDPRIIALFLENNEYFRDISEKYSA